MQAFHFFVCAFAIVEYECSFDMTNTLSYNKKVCYSYAQSSILISIYEKYVPQGKGSG